MEKVEGNIINPNGSKGAGVFVPSGHIAEMRENDHFRIISDIPNQMRAGSYDLIKGTLLLYAEAEEGNEEFYKYHGLSHLPEINYHMVKQKGGDLLPPGSEGSPGMRYCGGVYMYVYPFLDAVKDYHEQIETAAVSLSGDLELFGEDIKIGEVISALGGD